MKLLSHIDRRGEPATVPGVALRGKRLFEPTPPSHEQQQRSADPSPINVLRQLHALNAEHSGMKAKHARLLEENTRLHADNTRLHADVTRLAAQAAQAEREAETERQRSASLQARVDAEAAAGRAAAQQLQEELSRGQELRGALQEQDALAQELQQELGRGRAISPLQGQVEELTSTGQLGQPVTESEASLRRVCSEREYGFLLPGQSGRSPAANLTQTLTLTPTLTPRP